jgi:hypothetical protein
LNLIFDNKEEADLQLHASLKKIKFEANLLLRRAQEGHIRFQPSTAVGPVFNAKTFYLPPNNCSSRAREKLRNHEGR